jgi:hypothetical protein
LPRAFFTEAEKLIDNPWSAAAIPDFMDPRTEGQRPSDFDDTLKFSAAPLRLAAVHKLLIEVQNLLKLRSAYRNPELVQRAKAVMAEAQTSSSRSQQ